MSSPDFAALRWVVLCKDYQIKSGPLFKIDQSWNFQCIRPLTGFIKVNCDASFDLSSSSVGLAALARDNEGLIIGIRMAYVSDCCSSLESEVKALSLALDLRIHIGARKVICELECTLVLQNLFGICQTPDRFRALY